MPEKARGALHLARFDERADIGRADGHAVQLHLGNDVAAKAERTAFFAQLLRIALILVAETEIVPRDEVYGAVLLHQQLGDEVLPRHGHHRAVKRLDKHRADAVILTDDLRALPPRL